MMRAIQNYKPTFSLSSFVVVLLAIPLLLLLSIFFMPLSSSPLEIWRTASNSSTSDAHSTYSLALSAAQELPQAPAEPPHISFSVTPSPAPAPTPQISTGVAKIGEQKRAKSWRSIQLEKLEASLVKARSSIKEAAATSLLRTNRLNDSITSKLRQAVGDEDPEYVPHGRIYWNARAFHRSYLLMEKLFKIYVYEEGEVPLFHEGRCMGLYSSGGRFIAEMEKGNLYRTKNPDEALIYFLPLSIYKFVSYLWIPNTNDLGHVKTALVDYINVIQHKYPFWNRSLGADHFMLSCHDWAPHISSFVPNLFHNSIRVLCNANTTEGFNPSKDVSFPEINLNPRKAMHLGGQPPSTRTLLAFFAGGLHGYIRYLLLNKWKDKDKDVQVYDKLPKGVSYETKMKSSKFCLCPSGYEVASPRIVEAIHAECVPVLISDSYVPPFSDVLNWKSFSVQIPKKNISDIKTILMGISHRQYLRMHRNVKLVQRHFVQNGPPKRYDVFHMTVHSIWLRRLNIRIQDSVN